MQMMIRCVMTAENLPAFVEGMTNVIAGMTVFETRDDSPDVTQTISYRGVPYKVGSASVAIDIVSDESWVEDIIKKVSEAHKKEEFHVRHLYIFPIEASYHIRNGFMDI
jgi:nitrogen regulatory protein PII